MCFTAQVLAAADRFMTKLTHGPTLTTTISSSIYNLTNHEMLGLLLPFPNYLLITQLYTLQSAETTLTGTSCQSINRLIGYCQTFIRSATLKVKTKQTGGIKTLINDLKLYVQKPHIGQNCWEHNTNRSTIQPDGLSLHGTM